MLPRKSVKKSPMQRFLNSPTKLFEEEKRLSFGAEDSNSLDKSVRLEARFRNHFEDSKKVKDALSDSKSLTHKIRKSFQENPKTLDFYMIPSWKKEADEERIERNDTELKEKIKELQTKILSGENHLDSLKEIVKKVQKENKEIKLSNKKLTAELCESQKVKKGVRTKMAYISFRSTHLISLFSRFCERVSEKLEYLEKKKIPILYILLLRSMNNASFLKSCLLTERILKDESIAKLKYPQLF